MYLTKFVLSIKPPPVQTKTPEPKREQVGMKWQDGQKKELQKS